MDWRRGKGRYGGKKKFATAVKVMRLKDEEAEDAGEMFAILVESL